MFQKNESTDLGKKYFKEDVIIKYSHAVNGVRRAEFLHEIPHSALGLIWLQGTETQSSDFRKRGFIIRQLLMEFKGGRTAEPQGGVRLGHWKVFRSHAAFFLSPPGFPVPQPRNCPALPRRLAVAALLTCLAWPSVMAFISHSTGPCSSCDRHHLTLSLCLSSNCQEKIHQTGLVHESGVTIFLGGLGFFGINMGRQASNWCSSGARERVFLKEESGLMKSQKGSLISVIRSSASVSWNLHSV